MMDNKGQVSFEYLLIFAISLIILIVFTLPLMQYSVENTLDVSDSIEVKADLEKISSAIKQVYGQGQGARQPVTLNVNKAIKININSNYVSSNLKLKDSSNKNIRVDCRSNFKSTSLSLKKGVNTVVVEWPSGSDKMIIYN